jgi:hypothetical protein
MRQSVRPAWGLAQNQGLASTLREPTGGQHTRHIRLLQQNRVLQKSQKHRN